MKKVLFVIVLLVLITAGCNLAPAKQNQVPINQPIAANKVTVTFLIPSQDTNTYCDGTADLQIQSAEFKKIVTKQVTQTIEAANLSKEDLIKETLSLAAVQSNFSPNLAADKTYIKIINDTAYLKPLTDAWAGSWRFLCLWQPFAEVNLLQFPEIKKVVWTETLDQFNQITSGQTSVNFLVSPDVYTKYCDGANMDSIGYKKSLTKLETRVMPGNLSAAEIAKQAVILASKASTLETVIDNEPDFIKIIGDTAYVKPIDGWAGVSIFMCAWQPLVETNLLQFSTIKKVTWMNDLQKWNELNK
jgi:hypothetical protein